MLKQTGTIHQPVAHGSQDSLRAQTVLATRKGPHGPFLSLRNCAGGNPETPREFMVALKTIKEQVLARKTSEGNRLGQSGRKPRCHTPRGQTSLPKKRASENVTVAQGLRNSSGARVPFGAIPQAKSTHSPSNPQTSTKTRVCLTQGLRPSSGAVPQHKKRALSGPFLVRGLSEHRGRSEPSGSQDYPLKVPCRP